MNTLRHYALYLAWLITLTAMLTTLYLGDWSGMPICHLCWYQRICLYPLAVLFAVALFGSDKNIKSYSIPLTVFGTCFAFYQYLEQMVPNFKPISMCSPSVPCSTIHILWLGFITLPFLSILCFLSIMALLILYKYE